ncbi:nickel/cobalt transporter [Salinispira pacifica]|uniref:Nickel/cobalt efflux system n=1 Tax=Salinispira pacifica TaxID=1307761 RepID=V5WJA6_9SPIO|nr:hypothetical protein [Salinispira pacifica]AHC15912.1 hypothetical protein L21SP2_2560 [Salinispira pacifica]
MDLYAPYYMLPGAAHGPFTSFGALNTNTRMAGILKKPLILFIFALFIGIGFAQSPLFAQDPFRSQGSEESTQVQIYSGNLPDFFLNWSRELNRGISEYSMAIQNEGGGRAIFISIVLAVLFGMLHVLGPGHGKLFTFSYIGSRRASITQGLILAGGINIVDSLSAALLVFGGYGILSVSFSHLQGRVSEVIQIISYSIIIIFSLWHLLSHLFHHRHSHHGHSHHGHSHHSHSHEHDHQDDNGPSESPSEMHSQRRDPRDRRAPWVLALTIGLIPCPVSTVILLFGLVNDMILHSIFLVAGVSLGGFISMAILTVALIKGRDAAVDTLSTGWGERLSMILETVSMAGIATVALLLLLPLLGG